jgi:hypothetical protein
VSQEEELVGREGSGGEAETEEKRREVVRESKGQAASAGTAQASEVGGGERRRGGARVCTGWRRWGGERVCAVVGARIGDFSS